MQFLWPLLTGNETGVEFVDIINQWAEATDSQQSGETIPPDAPLGTPFLLRDAGTGRYSIRVKDDSPEGYYEIGQSFLNDVTQASSARTALELKALATKDKVGLVDILQSAINTAAEVAAGAEQDKLVTQRRVREMISGIWATGEPKSISRSSGVVYQNTESTIKFFAIFNAGSSTSGSGTEFHVGATPTNLSRIGRHTFDSASAPSVLRHQPSGPYGVRPGWYYMIEGVRDNIVEF